MSFRKIGEFVSPWLVRLATLWVCGVGCFTDFWLLGLPCLWLFGLPFGSAFFALLGWLAWLLPRRLPCSPFWANFALLGWLACLLAVILSGVRKHKAKNPYFKKCNLHFKFKNLRLNLNSTYSANCGKWILRYAQYDKQTLLLTRFLLVAKDL